VDAPARKDAAFLSQHSAAAAPPLLPFVLSVGVTGHRSDSLSPDTLADLAARIRATLQLVGEATNVLFDRERGCFADTPPLLRFVSPIADGSDQVAAALALELGWELQAVLPFARDEYRRSLADDEARIRFDALLEGSTCALELPGDWSRELDAYIMAGRATVAHCDALIAVWDGLPPRGRGGTGEVVQLAITRGTAVIHLHPDASRPPRLLWSGFDPAVPTAGDDVSVERPVDRANVEALLARLLMPPADPQEHAFLRRFATERLRKVRTRLEYPLLLAATGVGRFGAKDFADKHNAARIAEEWRQYRQGCQTANGIDAPTELLEQAYGWADRLATHFAQTYRSGHIFNFVLGGIAVCLGLGAFMAPQWKFAIAAIEFFITLAIILNAHIGTRNEWHRRWLDYRQLAERLRPMRSLKLLGIAAPDPPGTATDPSPRRWIDWYASGVWKAIGCPGGSLNGERTARLAAAIADHEVAPQVGYHERNARQVNALDSRLGKVGFALFLATLLVSVATLVGLWLDAPFVNDYGNWFTLVSAGFPALGTAVFGIRFQADFGGDAVRSVATANTLRQIDTELRKDVTLLRAADLVEQAGRVMLSDLDEWRLVNQQRDLSVG
jgi:hypothetical protein